MVYAPRSRSVLRPPLDNTNGLVGWWPFDDGLAYDVSGNNNHGVLNNSPGFAAGMVPGERAPGSLLFNGSNTYVAVPSLAPSAITVSVWAYSSNFSQKGMLVEKANVNAAWELFFETDGNAEILGGLKWRGASASGIRAAFPSNNSWHHIAATQTGTSAILYQDGVQVSSGTITAIGTGGGAISIGRYEGGYYFNGNIDDVRIYNRVLSAAEINEIYNSAFVPRMEAEMPALLGPAKLRNYYNTNNAVNRAAYW